MPKSDGTFGLNWSSRSSQRFRPDCCCSWGPLTTSGPATSHMCCSEASISSWCLLQRTPVQFNYLYVVILLLSINVCMLFRFQIASSLTKELCALVFGINTFLGTILKSIINLIFSDKRGLGLDVHKQVIIVNLTMLTSMGWCMNCDKFSCGNNVILSMISLLRVQE